MELIVITGPCGVGKSTVSRAVAATFERSVHLNGDDFMAAIVSGWVDPNLAEADEQNYAVGAAIATSAMSFALEGYTTIVDGYFFPDGAAGLAAACAGRGLQCHYAVLTADLDACWARASARPEGRWPLEWEPVAALHARFATLDVDPRHEIDATGSPESVTDAVLRALGGSRLALT